MTAPLQRVLVCPPANAGWNDPEKSAAWRDLGFHHPPDFVAAQSAHDTLCHHLTNAGAEVLVLPTTAHLTLDAVYTHDASLPTNHGLILMRPGKTTRIPEAQAQAAYCARQPLQRLSRRDGACPVSVGAQDEASLATKSGTKATAQVTSVLAEITAPATSEAGDIVWLDDHTLLVGQGYRTNRAGIDQLRSFLAPHQIEVLSAPLPYGPGPSACLHLMSLMSMLDEATILVDLPWLSVETVELLQAHNFRFIEIDYSERDTLACNVLALGKKRLIALQENVKTNQRLRQAGFEVHPFPGSELCINGAGGPTCLTRPLQRG